MIRAQREIDAEEIAKAKAELATLQPAPEAKPRLSVAEIMGRIQLAASKGDFETAKTLQAMLA